MSMPPTPPYHAQGGQVLAYEIDPVAAQAAQLNLRFKIYWICFAAGIPLSCVLIGIGGIITGIVFCCMLQYALWEIVQPSKECQSPAQAVGFMFIPLFNLYWRFVCVWGLAKELNRVRAERGIPGKPVNEQMALTACILFCCGLVPYLGLLAVLTGVVLEILTMNDMKNAGIDILRANAMTPSAITPRAVVGMASQEF